MADAFVVIDAGTGGGKCLIFDAAGQVLGAHREPWTYDLRLNPDIPFVKEFSFNAVVFWGILCHCVRTALSRAQVAPAAVVGVAATSQREGCVFLDAQGTEVYAGPNIDARGFAEGLEVLSVLGHERLYRITGHSAPFIFPLARYLWFRKHGSPAVAQLLMINDWITYRLSGELSAEPSNATESMLFDLEGRRWSEEILSTFDIPHAILPALRTCGERVGSITAAAAAATGLAAGTPVFVGGADTQCSLLGTGALDPPATAATLGTTSPVQTVVDRAVFDPQANLWVGCHVVPDRWVLESNAGDTGDAYLWLLDLINGERPREELYALGEQLAAAPLAVAPLAPARADTAPPAMPPAPSTMLFVGPTIFNLTKMRINRPGGMLFPFPSLHVRPDRGTLVRAFMESVGYALRANLEQLMTVYGPPRSELILSGGMSRSHTLTQIIADIAGIPVRVARQPESAALGCAMLIMANAGGGGGLTAAVRTMVGHARIEPDPQRQARYQAAYAKWRELYELLDEMEV